MGQSYFNSQLSFPLSRGICIYSVLNEEIKPAQAQLENLCWAGRLHTCVPDDVIKDYEPLELQLQLTVGVFRQRLGLEPPQPEICILVPIDKELEGADLVRGQQVAVLMLDTVHTAGLGLILTLQGYTGPNGMMLTFGGSPILWKRWPTLGTFSRANLFPRDFTRSMAL